jgi:glyoxylase-like metal-dependent hydrolase (beta-lactamase superfamily II)
MNNRLRGVFVFLILIGGTAAAQDDQDAKEARAVLQAAAKAIGSANLKSIQYSGNGLYGFVGQNWAPQEDWPRALMNYTRTIDYDSKSSKEEFSLTEAKKPPLGGGNFRDIPTPTQLPVDGELRRTVMVSGNYAWNMEGNNINPAPSDAEERQLEIWLTPHGFLKAAMAADKVTMVTRWEDQALLRVVSIMVLGKYRVNASINSENQIERIQTWIPNPVRGDMYYELRYSRYKDFGGGVMFPTRFHHHIDHDDNGNGIQRMLGNVSGGHNAFSLAVKDVKVNLSGGAPAVPDVVRTTPITPVRVESQKLADGVWYLGGGSHASVAVEFKDFVTVVEAPLNEQRSLAVMSEVKKLIPNKRIRYLVNTHQHWDHIGGMRTYVHEGATIITHGVNRAFYEEVLLDFPWTLAPDRLSLAPPAEVAEGRTFEVVGDKYVLSDGIRNLEIHHMEDYLDHTGGMLVAYLPKEKILVEADLFSPGADSKPRPDTRAFYDNIQRLKLDVSQIVPIEGKITPMADFVKFVGEPE